MLALAGALAFGLGGRDVAAQLLQSAYDRGGQAKEQARQDAKKGAARATSQMQTYPAETASPARTRASRT